MAEPDWVARGIAGASFLVSGGALYFARFDSRWKRRHAALDPLRGALEDLRAPVSNPGDQIQLQSLFTVTTGAELEMLESAVDRIPDRRLRPRLRKLVSNLNDVRSGQHQPSGTASLTPMQTKKLATAKTDLEWVLTRIDKAAQRGVT